MQKFIVVAMAAMMLAGCRTVRHDLALTGATVDGNGPIPRRRISFESRHKPGTIVISTKERRLYLVTGAGDLGWLAVRLRADKRLTTGQEIQYVSEREPPTRSATLLR